MSSRQKPVTKYKKPYNNHLENSMLYFIYANKINNEVNISFVTTLNIVFILFLQLKKRKF